MSIAVAFDLPFAEAVAALQARRAVLPDDWYMMPARAKKQAFSIAGLTALDQIEGVRDKLAEILRQGGSFKDFQEHAATLDWKVTPANLETIYRNAVQTAYNAGAWERFERGKANRPFLMYSAVDDSRTRPAHQAISGIIRPVDDAFWLDHSPPLGHRCRCRLLALTAAQAQARSRGANQGLNKAVTPEMTADGPDWGSKPAPLTASPSTPPALDSLEKKKLAAAPASVQAGYAARPVPAAAGRVSDALLLPKSGIAKKAAEAVLAEIDAIHSVDPLPPIPVVNSTAHTSKYIYTLPTFSAKQISITKLAAEPELSAAHEIGHFIDHQSINGQRGFASKHDPLLEEWRTAVSNSKAAAGLMDNAKNGTKLQRDNAIYYLKTHEAWARAYAQYIAERGGNAKMKEQLAAILRDTGNPRNQYRQWEADDFKPIAQAIDALFVKLGWLK